MKKKINNQLLRIIIIIFISSISFTTYSQTKKYKGYKKSKTGLQYKFYKQNKKAKKPIVGDILHLEMRYKTEKDSVIFDSKTEGSQPVYLQLYAPTYKGDIVEGVSMLSVGDSASFVVSADSFFVKNVGLGELPPFVVKGSFLTFDMVLKGFDTKEDYENMKKIQAEKEAIYIDSLKAVEIISIKQYIDSNKITREPSPSGMYYLEILKGTGERADNHKTVKVHYKGTFLNGKVFDSSYDRNEPIEFKLGEHQVIPGWEEGLMYMNVGGKAKFIIPSQIAYGEAGAGGGIIPPFCPLVFEVELIEVK